MLQPITGVLSVDHPFGIFFLEEAETFMKSKQLGDVASSLERGESYKTTPNLGFIEKYLQFQKFFMKSPPTVGDIKLYYFKKSFKKPILVSGRICRSVLSKAITIALLKH